MSSGPGREPWRSARPDFQIQHGHEHGFHDLSQFPGAIPALPSVGMFLLLAGHVHDCVSHRLSFELLIHSQGRFGSASSSQPPRTAYRGFHSICSSWFRRRNRSSRSGRTPDRKVQGRMLLRRSMVSKRTIRRTTSLNCTPRPNAEVFYQKGCRQPPVHLNLMVLAGPGAFQNLRREVRARI